MVDRFSGKEGEMRDYLTSLHPVGAIGTSEEIARGGSLSLFRRREIYHRHFPRGGWRNASPIKNTFRNRNIMSRTIEVDFVPAKPLKRPKRNRAS